MRRVGYGFVRSGVALAGPDEALAFAFHMAFPHHDIAGQLSDLPVLGDPDRARRIEQAASAGRFGSAHMRLRFRHGSALSACVAVDEGLGGAPGPRPEMRIVNTVSTRQDAPRDGFSSMLPVGTALGR